MVKFSFQLIGLLVLLPIVLQAQVDSVDLDTMNLSEVTIWSSELKRQEVGSQTIRLAPNELNKSTARNVGDLLNHSNIYVKQYGPGTLSSISTRGGSAGQTLALWNGMPISSPTLGLLDLSLIPIGAVESVQLEKGGNAALWGSGAIGAVLDMNSNASHSSFQQDKFNLSFEQFLSLGSFDQWQGRTKLAMGNKKLQFISKYNFQKAENDYPFLPAPDLPEKRLVNAAQEAHHFIEEIVWKPNAQNKLQLTYWKQQIDRGIPPTVNQDTSSARQEDLADRLTFNWKLKNDFLEAQLNAGFFDEQNNYFDKSTNLTARNVFKNRMIDVSLKKSFGDKHNVLLGTSYFNTTAETTSYKTDDPEEKIALFLSYKFQLKKLQAQLSLREEWINETAIPFVPNLGIQYLLGDKFTLKMKAGKNYRLPTLNDRYWRPGGNLALLPEQGWSEEIGIEYYNTAKKGIWKIKLVGFNRVIEDWILWSRFPGDFFFSPANISKVHSRGLESMASFYFEKMNWQFHLMVQHDYILATNQKDLLIPRIEKGAQLWYTPKHQGKFRFTATFKELNFRYNHFWIGSTIGFNKTIPGYQLGSFEFNTEFQFHKKWKTTYGVSIQNLWNKNYEVVEFRPMPGRNFQLFAKINFN